MCQTASPSGWASRRQTCSSLRCAELVLGCSLPAAPGFAAGRSWPACSTLCVGRLRGVSEVSYPLSKCPLLAPTPQFLPPLLVDSAIRIDFFMFTKVGGLRGREGAVFGQDRFRLPARGWAATGTRVCPASLSSSACPCMA
jgi:hypothetical protein